MRRELLEKQKAFNALLKDNHIMTEEKQRWDLRLKTIVEAKEEMSKTANELAEANTKLVASDIHMRSRLVELEGILNSRPSEEAAIAKYRSSSDYEIDMKKMLDAGKEQYLEGKLETAMKVFKEGDEFKKMIELEVEKKLKEVGSQQTLVGGSSEAWVKEKEGLMAENLKLRNSNGWRSYDKLRIRYDVLKEKKKTYKMKDKEHNKKHKVTKELVKKLIAKVKVLEEAVEAEANAGQTRIKELEAEITELKKQLAEKDVVLEGGGDGSRDDIAASSSPNSSPLSNASSINISINLE